MSSYFDQFDKLVRQYAEFHRDDNEAFLKSVVALEKTMIHTCELFAGDIDTPDDIRQAIIACIALHQVRYAGGDFLGDAMGESPGAQFAVACKRSKLSVEMHSLWHDIARRRLQLRYGLVMDNPEHAVKARDRYAEERFGALKARS